MALDQEKQLMESTLRHIAFGDNYISPADMIRLAAKALGQVSDIRMKRMLKQAEAKIAKANMPSDVKTPVASITPKQVKSMEIDVDGIG